MSGVLFVGDPHGDLGRVRAIARRHRPAAVVLLGDVEVGTSLDMELAPVLDAGIAIGWIYGNHDSDREGSWRGLTDPDLNPRTAGGALHGRVLEIGGFRMAGLGGIFKGRLWDPRSFPSPDALRELKRLRRDHPRWFLDAIPSETVDQLSDLKADILVSHEAPSSHVFGFAIIDDLARSMGARMVVHGHHHCDYAATSEADRLLAVGVGPLSAVDETGGLVEQGPADRRRQAGLSGPGWKRLR